MNAPHTWIIELTAFAIGVPIEYRVTDSGRPDLAEWTEWKLFSIPPFDDQSYSFRVKESKYPVVKI